MADYVSNYTGKEIDEILSQAVELPVIPTASIEYNPNFTGGDFSYKVLAVDSSGYNMGWVNESVLFPTVTGNDGKVLGINGSHLEWMDYLPSTTTADSGKFLRYDGSNLIWDTIPTPDLPSLTDIVGLHGQIYNGYSLMYDSDLDGYYLGDPFKLKSATNGAVLKYVVSGNDGTEDYMTWGSPFPEDGISEGAILKVHSNGETYWDSSTN